MDGREQTFKQKVDGFRNFLWNPQEKKVMGRSGRSWAEIGFFYLVFYSCLAGFFAGLIAVFYQTIDDKYPKLMGESSLLRGNPGMGYKPKPDIDSTLIRFIHGQPDSYKVFKTELNDFIAKYENQTDSDYADCTNATDELRPGQTKPCRVDYDALTADCNANNDYGFSSGEPCIVLKLNKIFNFSPELYDPSDLPESMPEDVRSNYGNASQIWVSCEGENPGDAENLGTPTYFPAQGFPLSYFPYQNQKGYLSPVVFVKFNGVSKNKGLMVECKAWAKNIKHDRVQKEGSVHFELLVD